MVNRIADAFMTRFQFSDFTLDVVSGKLLRDDAAIDLRPKLYALLQYMVEHSGRLLSKNELMAAVWPETNVADGSLNRAVTELRAALGDDREEPRMIETVPRRGYRFIAQVIAQGAPARELSSFFLTHADRRFSLFKGANIVGRTADADVELPFGSVSRVHARIVVGDRVTIEDLGSTNGTFVRGKPVRVVTEIEAGDQIRIGKEDVVLMSSQLFYGPTDRLK